MRHTVEPSGTAGIVDFRYVSAGASDRGISRPNNEDALLDQPGLRLWAVADGMGGHNAGDVASSTVVSWLQRLAPMPTLAASVERAKSCIADANLELFLRGAAQGRENVIGTTVAVLIASSDRVCCLWAGDSRVYLYRDGTLRQLTRDHTQVEALVKHGLLEPEQARTHPSGNIITRAIGAEEEIRLEECEETVQLGDVLLLCTDGLTKFLEEGDIVAALEKPDCSSRVESLIESALVKQTRDNVTAIVVEVMR